MAGMMSGQKGMGAARMKARFGKKKKKGPPPKKGEKETPAEAAQDTAAAEGAEVKQRKFSSTL